MAGDYIRRRKVEFELCGGNLPEKYKAFVRRVLNDKNLVPAADVAPVVHGRWIKDDFLSDDVNNAEKCSQCGELIGWFSNLPNYCPNCGARMDGGEDRAGS